MLMTYYGRIQLLYIREIYNRVHDKLQTWDARFCFLEKYLYIDENSAE